MPVTWELVIDCADADRTADFWCAALGYRRFGTAGQYRSAVPEQGSGPKLIFQAVHEPKTVKNRLHIDVLTADIESEAQRLSHLGGHRAHNEPISEYGTQWIVMHDPGGNEFCVCQM